MRALGRVRQPRRPRQAGDAAAAAETEDRQPFDRRLELEAIEQLCVEARYGEPGDRIGDENVDCVERDAGRRRCLERHIGQEIERMLLKDGGAFFPGVRLEIPLDRLAIVAQLDAGIVVERPQTFQMRENLLGAARRFGLAEFKEGLAVATDKISTSKPPVTAAALALGLILGPTTSSMWNFPACPPGVLTPPAC